MLYIKEALQLTNNFTNVCKIYYNRPQGLNSDMFPLKANKQTTLCVPIKGYCIPNLKIACFVFYL